MTASRLSQVWQRAWHIPNWLRSTIGARFWLRSCDRVGPGTKTHWRPLIDNRGRIAIGAKVRFNSHWVPIELVTGTQGVIEIGDSVFVNYGTLISANKQVKIGNGVMLGNYCIVADTEVAGAGPTGARLPDARGIVIGDGAWLAARVTVLPGASIGARAVIAAGSVVAGNIPDGAIAGGIPARIIRGSE